MHTSALGDLVHLYQVLLDQQQAAGLKLRRELVVRFLAQGDEDVRTGHVRVEDRLARENYLGAAGSAARLRAEVLRHGGVTALEDRGGLPDYAGGEDDALPAESRNSDFR